MTSEQKPTPIIVCGQSEQIGAGVMAGLKPEYEVVHFAMTTAACISEIPVVLQGQTPSNPSSTLGTGDVSRRPVAVVLGGGFADAFDQVRDGVESAFATSGSSGVVWLRHDGSKPAPPLGPEYGKAMVQRVKETLGRLDAEGSLGSGKTEVHWF